MKWQPGQGISVDKEGTANANGQTRDRSGPAGGLPPLQPLRRPRGSRRQHHRHRRPLSRPEAESSQRRGGQVGRQHLFLAIRRRGRRSRRPSTRPELDIAGVYRVSPDLKEINMVVRDFVNPNGLTFSPDEKILYINDSNRHRKLIRAYDVEGNGMLDLGSERLFCDMRGDDRPGAPTA